MLQQSFFIFITAFLCVRASIAIAIATVILSVRQSVMTWYQFKPW